MTQSLQRQRRLLAVRSLQADFAAAEVRRSQLDAEEKSEQLHHARQLARPNLHPLFLTEANHLEWVLRCAEQELAGIDIDRHTEALDQIHVRTAALGQQEQQARREREQIKAVCERLKQTVEYTEQIRDQASLDDLFNAAYIRRLS